MCGQFVNDLRRETSAIEGTTRPLARRAGLNDRVTGDFAPGRFSQLGRCPAKVFFQRHERDIRMAMRAKRQKVVRRWGGLIMQGSVRASQAFRTEQL
jgi:hypothetical protein